jgi:serine/threonine protein kinase
MISDNIPETFANRYKIIEKLGAGGMGIVYLAHDPVLNIDVAVKVLASDPTGITAARLQREAVAAGSLNHPNIAKVFDFGQTSEGSPYMVMEHVSGKSLAELILERGRIPIDEAVGIFEQILQGLSIAHAHKIIHRDLKPSNIMVANPDAKEKQVKLLDFGVAKLEVYNQELTSTGALLGSPTYMSPEQAMGLDADSRSDIYSFGCLMFETLTGQPPFRGNTAFETISMHKAKAPPLVTDLVPELEISNDLVNLIDSCLSKSAQARPRNCSDLIDKLKAKSEPKIQIEESPPLVQYIESKTFMGHSQAVVAMVSIFAVALVAFAFVMITASIKSQVHKKEDESFSKANNKQLGNSGFGGQRGADLMYGISSHRDTTTDGDSTLKFNAALDDADLDRIDKNQKRIDFGNINVTPEQLQSISTLPLESLQLRGQELNDNTVRHIAKIKTLKTLYCKNTLLTNIGLLEIGKLSNLQSLRLGCPFVTSDGLVGFKNLTHLKSLQLDGDRLGDDTALYLVTLPSLTSIGIGSKSLSDQGVANLKKLPKLQALTISSPQVTDQSLTYLKDFKMLNIANFDKCKFSPDFALKLKPGKNLYGLSILNQRYFSIASAKALGQTNISILNLKGTAISDDNLIAIAGMKRISSLHIEAAPITIKGLAALKSPPLASFDFINYLNINDAIVKKLSQLKNLRSLQLSHTNIVDNQLMMLASLGKLEYLNLDGCPGITPEGIEAFQKLYMSMHQKECPIHRATVLARDIQEAENFKNGKKDWRVKYKEGEEK